MRTSDQIQLSAGEPTGHTAQYVTIARALGNALGSMEDTIDQYSKTPGWTEAPGSLQIEAHCVTVTLLSAALCESVANTILAILHSPDVFDPLERNPTVEKWMKRIPSAVQRPTLIPESLRADLCLLFSTRNSIAHAKAMVFTEQGNTIHEGTPEMWNILSSVTARRFAVLTLDLVDCLPLEVGSKLFGIRHGVREHWLVKALARRNAEPSRAPVAQPVLGDPASQT